MSDTDRNSGAAGSTDADPIVPGEAPADPAYAAGAGFTGEATAATPPEPEPTAGPDPLGADQPDAAHPEIGAATTAGATTSSTSSTAALAVAGDSDTKTMVIIAHVANILGVFTGGLGNLAALILAYVKKDSSPEWARTHFVLVIRTVFIALIASIALIVLSVVAVPLLFVGVGFAMYPVIGLLWLALSAWVVVRSVVALLKATREEAYPNPETWLV